MGLGDMMARSQAAGGMMRGGAEEGMGMPPEGMMPEEELAGAPPAMDMESALAGVEAALEGEAPENAEEIRVHLNAIRDIVGRSGEKAAAPEAGLEELAAEAPPMEGGDAPPMPA